MSRRNNRVGEVHGVFTVVSFAYVKNARTFWNCICSNCGSSVVRDNRYFRKDRATPRCCINCVGQHHPNYKGHGKLTGVYLARIEKQAIDRNYSFNVSPEYLLELFDKQDGRCYLTNEELKFTRNKAPSLDRIDNKIGYEVGNVAWCLPEINKMKGTMTLERFTELCKKVKEPNVLKKD